MNQDQTDYEKDFSKKIEKFCKDENCSLSKLLNSQEVSYSNIDKVRDFIRGEGTITMRVAGRINQRIDKVEKSKSSKSNG